jgi:hypothetical protein
MAGKYTWAYVSEGEDGKDIMTDLHQRLGIVPCPLFEAPTLRKSAKARKWRDRRDAENGIMSYDKYIRIEELTVDRYQP